MNILFIPTKDPRLKNGGNEQRTNLLWESLKRHGTVYTFLVDYSLDCDYEMVKGEHPIYKIRPKFLKFSFWRIISVILYRLSFYNVYKRKTIKIKNPQIVFNNISFDVVVTRYVIPLCVYKYWEIAPLLIDVDDHPLQVYDTVHKKRIPIGLKTIGKFLTKLQTNYIINKSVGGWIANKEQEKSLGNNYMFLPNIPQFPSASYQVENNERNNLFTVGVMAYGPNKEGVTHFLGQIWPSFHEKYPDVQYFIVGKGASDVEVKLWNNYEGVKYLGFVEDLELLYEKTLATVVPVYSGGGTCIKTLESMAYSRPCISTPFGARGLAEDVINGEKGILLFEDAESFINAYERVLDSNRRDEIEEQGRHFVTSNYSVDSFDKAVDDVVLNARLLQ